MKTTLAVRKSTSSISISGISVDYDSLTKLIKSTFCFTSGCSRVFINGSYSQSNKNSKTFLVLPVSGTNVNIIDSSIVDLIEADFGVSRKRAVQLLDSLVTIGFSLALRDSSTSYDIIYPKIIDSGFQPAVIARYIAIHDPVTMKILNKLGISIPSK